MRKRLAMDSSIRGEDERMGGGSFKYQARQRYKVPPAGVSGSLYLTLTIECVKQATPMAKRSLEIWGLGTGSRIRRE